MPSGKVKWYDAEKGFGFLSQEGGEDVYVRADALPAGVETLRPRQRVEFDMVSGRRGPQALRVVVHDEPAAAEERALAEGPPLGRIAESAEIAALVAFLLSHEAGYVSGQSIAADGAWTASFGNPPHDPDLDARYGLT